MTDKALLEVKNLSIAYRKDGKDLSVVDHIDFSLQAGECLGLVGESGCGKSTTALGLLKLLPKNARIQSGSASFHGEDLLQLNERQLRGIRGHKIACVFQDPMSSLNPYMRIVDQLCEPLRLHLGMSKKEAVAESIQLATQVALPTPESSIQKYPHELSGGQRQRVMIAMALSCKPEILIADEPSTALDVTVQKQILDLMKLLQQSMGMAMLLITHDLGVVHQVCDRVAVLYAGRIAEIGDCNKVLARPQHPYTHSLMRAVPRIDSDPTQALAVIEGLPPALGQIPAGCAFANRCPHVTPACAEPITLEQVDQAHFCACIHNSAERNTAPSEEQLP